MKSPRPLPESGSYDETKAALLRASVVLVKCDHANERLRLVIDGKEEVSVSNTKDILEYAAIARRVARGMVGVRPLTLVLCQFDIDPILKRISNLQLP